MSKTTMPVAEADVTVALDDERNSYEFAFHVLPTVAEGEVTGVFDGIKARIEGAGGELFDEEAPERVDLAYDIVKQIEDKHRKFHSAYFGWVRFKLGASDVEKLDAELTLQPEMLRTLMLKLTKDEQRNPFRYHEAHKQSMVETVDEDAPVKAETKVEEKKEVKEEEKEEVKKTKEEATEEKD